MAGTPNIEIRQAIVEKPEEIRPAMLLTEAEKAEKIKIAEKTRDISRVGMDELRTSLDASEKTPEIKAFLQKLTHIQNSIHAPVELHTEVKSLLDMIKNTPSLAQNRDLMDFFRQALEGFVIPQDVKDEINAMKMNEDRGNELKKSLNINSETLDALDEGTRQIIKRIHTGFYQFDSDINGWVDALGGRLFLWPENIDGIEKYLNSHNKDHPFMTSIRNKDFRSNDSTGKYAFKFTGKPHNIHLAEAEYLQNYIALRATDPAMKDDQIVAELKKTHAVTVKAQGAIDAFENKYGSLAKVDTPKDVSKQLPEISKRLETKYTELGSILTGDNYPALKKQFESISQSRPEMKEILYDIQSGFLDYNSDNNIWMTYNGTKIVFSEAENALVRTVIDKTLKSHPLSNHPEILGPKTNEERPKVQYVPSVVQRRVDFYKQ